MPSVLLVDDNSLLRHSLRRLLESAGFEVCGDAEDGLHAIEQTAALHPDLIILDYALPKMNGLEAAGRLRRLNPRLPIILFTLFATTALEELAKDAGISAVVGKTQPLSVLVGKAKALVAQNRPPDTIHFPTAS